MKAIKIAIMPVVAMLVMASCDKPKGDNSDYDFSANRGTESPYKDGYGRLPNSVRLATYNVHRCEGPITQDPNKDMAHYNKTALVVKLMDPDAIALQELDENTSWHPVSQIGELAERTGMKATFGRTIDQRGGQYGNGILSKTTPLNTSNQPIPQVDTEYEKRAALFAEFDDYVFIATHFCHKSSKNRKKSVEFITEYVATTYGGDFEKPVFLAGDLNEDKIGSEVMLELLKDWKIVSSNDYTHKGEVRIDYVLVYTGNEPSYGIIGAAAPVYDEIDVYTVSDHNPTMVDLNEF